MAMFYSLQEAAEKLSIKEEQVQELVKQGRLREFRDGANVLFKIDEVEALMSDTSIMASKDASAEPQQETDADEISLEADATESKDTTAEEGEDTTAGESKDTAAGEDEDTAAGESKDTAAGESKDTAAGDELMDADTVVAGQGINVLGEADSDFKPTDDTMADTGGGTSEVSLEEIEEDVNLDTFGSGSGLLDLSLQADDTSLGGILDEIYTSEDEQDTGEASAMEVVAEAKEMLPEEEESASPELAPNVPTMAQAYVEPAPDTLSNAFGIMLFLPLLAIVYTAIVAVAGFNDVMPSVLGKIQGMNGPYGIHIIWYVVVGAGVAAGLIVGVAFMLSSEGAKAGKKVKARKPKKPKKAKAKK